MNKTYFSITQQAREVDIYIFGDITSWPYKDGDYSAGSLVKAIQELDADVINVHIDCFGGSVKEGWGIYNALKQCKAEVNTYADGFVASAALYPFLAGEQRIASAVSAFYMHEASTYGHGYASDLRKAADDVEKLTEIGIQAFVEVTGTSKEKIHELMQAETWLKPSEALELKIATAVMEADPTQSFSQSVRENIVQVLTAVQQEPGEPKPPTPTNTLSKFFA